MIGSRGRTLVTGGQLRARLGLFDTWAFFTSITHRRGAAAEPDGGAADRRHRPVRLRGVAEGAHPIGRLAGRVLPVLKSGIATVQRRDAGAGSTSATARVRRGGRYSYDVTVPGPTACGTTTRTAPAVRVR